MAPLLERVEQTLYAQLAPIKALIPYTRGELISLFHEQGLVEHTEHLEEGVLMHGRVPERLVERFAKFPLKLKARKKAAR
jgi:GTP-binding protein HflX